jgi:hypothetical protein
VHFEVIWFIVVKNQRPKIQSLTTIPFNRQITAGNINPHQFIANADYLGQLHYQSKTILKHYHYSEALSIFTSFYVLSLTIACHVSST